MCLPALPLIGIGLSLAGSAANFAQESAYTSGYNSYQERISKRNQDLARQSAENQYSALGVRQIQERVRTGTEVKKIQTEALAAQGRVKAAAAEAGVSGNSVEALLADFNTQEGNYIDSLTASEQFFAQQAEFERKGIRLGLESRLINSVPDRKQAPNLFGSALSAFTDAFSVFGRYEQQNARYGGNTFIV